MPRPMARRPSTAAVYPVPRHPPPANPMLDAVGSLRVAVEVLACGSEHLRPRTLRALGHVALAEQVQDQLPSELRAKLKNVRSWVAVDPTLKALGARDVDYITIGVVDAFHCAARLHVAPAAKGEAVH